ncbi:MAG: DUF494 domain-containing protein [Proteobacteria bacterium]|nr:DUF494 domain-containing protein [Pseudomonadota bacterium]
MFDVLVYLYETYYRPDACPDSDALVKKLSAAGFEEGEISQALGWLTDLGKTASEFSRRFPTPSATGIRFYAQMEYSILGVEGIGFIQFLESAKLLDAPQREVVIECALTAGEGAISLDKLKVIVLMVLWSQGKEPDGLMFDELFGDNEENAPRLLH